MQEHVSVEQILIHKKEFFDQINDLYLFMLRIIMLRIFATFLKKWYILILSLELKVEMYSVLVDFLPNI